MIRKGDEMTLETENRRNMHYSEHEDNIILLMLSYGKSPEEIANKLGHGRTIGGVSHRIDYLMKGRKKPSSNISDSEAAIIAKMHLDGKTSGEICEFTGRSDRTVARISRIADSIVSIINKSENT